MLGRKSTSTLPQLYMGIWQCQKRVPEASAHAIARWTRNVLGKHRDNDVVHSSLATIPRTRDGGSLS